ncbi:MAG: tetratricopeptide repeat protein [Bacteroidota bacterium]
MKNVFYLILVLFIVSCGTKKKTGETTSALSKVNYPYIEKFHEGLRYKHKGQFPQAIAAFEGCLLANPNDDAVCYALSELYLETKQLAKSSLLIERAVQLDPKNKWYLQEYAYMLFEAKNYKEAAKCFKTLSQLEPNNVDWLFSYAEALMRSNDISGSVKVLDKLENEIGMNPELSIEKFKLYRKIKQDEKAVNEITKCLLEFPSDAQLLANLVDYYFEKKEDEKAFSYLIKLADAQPNNGNAHMALAQFYDKKGDKKKSYQELIKAFACDDVVLDMKVKILLSMFESQFKLDPEMMELANILVNKYPNDARVFTVRGDFNLKEQKEKEALFDFKEAIKLDQTKFAIWEQVLIMEYQAQDYKSLYLDSKKCLEYFPAIAKVYLFFGLSANQEKKYDEAIEKLIVGEELIVNDNVLKGEMLAQKGDAYFALKKIKEGKEAYEKALKLDDKNILYKNNYAYRLALANTELDKAESLIKQVIEVSPNESHFLDTYGWVLFQKGKYEEALTQFKLALVKSPKDKHLLEHQGDALFKLGKTNEAVVLWILAKELGSTNLKLNDKIEKKAYYDPQY